MIKRSSYFLAVLSILFFANEAFAAKYKLYFAKGAASLAPEILLKELNQSVDLEEVVLATHTLKKDGSDYYKINQTGMVPAITTSDGKLLTETAVILQYFADKDKSGKFLPSTNEEERYFVLEKLNFVATEIHKSIAGWFHTKDKDYFVGKVKKHLGQLDSSLKDKEFIANNKVSIADFYLTSSLLEIQSLMSIDLKEFSNINKYLNNMKKRPSVENVLKAEGLEAWLK